MDAIDERTPDGPALWTSTPLWVAGALAAIEALTWLTDSWLFVGFVPLSGSAAAGVIAVAALARRGRFGASSVPIFAFLAVAACCAAFYSDLSTPFALIAAASGEEAVYRLALPLLVAAALRGLEVPRPIPAVVATSSVAVLFAFLPGHVAQFEASVFGPAPWIGLAVMWVWMLWRGASIAVVVAHHAAMNCMAFATADGAAPWLWVAAVALPAAAWMVLEGIRDRRLGLDGLLIADSHAVALADR